ncbi:hypothetical protein EJ110_NYTH59247 [Nymphaea thermarum]|nr:hypothetical protein EJ110_NYTH59247 [Nymphaea thermarum]
MATQLRSATYFFFFLFFFFMAASFSASMAAYTPLPPGSWKDIAGARTSPEFIDAAKFAAAEYNKKSSGTKLVFVRVLEGQVWATMQVGMTTYQLVMEAKTSAGLYKVYKCVLSQVLPFDPRTSELRWASQLLRDGETMAVSRGHGILSPCTPRQLARTPCRSSCWQPRLLLDGPWIQRILSLEAPSELLRRFQRRLVSQEEGRRGSTLLQFHPPKVKDGD